jgi:hypothetical protein
LGIKGGKNGNNMGFGNLTTLKVITTDNNTNKVPKSRVIRISEPVYQLLKDHSKKYHPQPISYDDIFEELCNYYNANHEQKWFLT